jgi:hypothetical protein
MKNDFSDLARYMEIEGRKKVYIELIFYFQEKLKEIK